MTANLYETLGVNRDASAAQIKSAFRKRAKRAHPDAGGNTDEFNRVNHAYVVLVDPARRDEYDRTGKSDGKVDNSHVEALTIINQMMDQMVEQVGDRTEVDVVAEMRKAMDMRLADIGRDVDKMRRKALRLAVFANKFRKDSGENVLRKMIEAKIAGVDRGIESAEKAKAGIMKARALLEGYSFDADPAEPQILRGWSNFTASTAA